MKGGRGYYCFWDSGDRLYHFSNALLLFMLPLEVSSAAAWR